MPKLRRLNGNQVMRILQSFGFEVIRIRGSHHQLERIIENDSQNLSVPVNGNKTLKTGTLKAIYRQASAYISEDELNSHFYTD